MFVAWSAISFDVADGREERQQRVDVVGHPLHAGDDVADDGRVVGVHLVVQPDDGPGGGGVGIHEGIERLPHHLDRPFGHRPQSFGMATIGGFANPGTRSAMAVARSPIRSRLRRDQQHRTDPPQVHRHRLVQCENLQTLLVDFVLQQVDEVVRLDDAVGQVRCRGSAAPGRPGKLTPRRGRPSAGSTSATSPGRAACAWTRQPLGTGPLDRPMPVYACRRCRIGGDGENFSRAAF